MQRLDWRLVLAVMAATGIGFLGAYTMPVWLEALRDPLGLSEGRAGLLGSAELLAGAAAAVLLAPRAARIRKRRLALLAGLAAAVGCAISAAASTFSALMLVRLATGACCGVVLAAGNAAAAGARDPDRIFAGAFFVAGGATSLLIVAVGYVTEAWGYRGAFLLLTGVCVLSLPLLGWLPERSAPRQAVPSERVSSLLPACATLTAYFLLSVAGQGLWAFIGRIGVRIGLSLDEIGVWVSLGNAAGLLSALVVAWLGTRLGRTFPLTLGIVACGLAQWMLVHAGSTVAFVASQVCWGLAVYLWWPFVMGTAASLDRQGRWTVAAGAVQLLGLALGPAAAGAALEYWPDAGLSILVAGCTIASLALIVPVSVALDRREHAVRGDAQTLAADRRVE